MMIALIDMLIMTRIDDNYDDVNSSFIHYRLKS